MAPLSCGDDTTCAESMACDGGMGRADGMGCFGATAFTEPMS